MQVILLKDYKPHSRVLKAGIEMGVTNSKGQELIEKGIAKDVTIEYKQVISRKREEESTKISEEIEEVKEVEEPIKKKTKIKQKK